MVILLLLSDILQSAKYIIKIKNNNNLPNKLFRESFVKATCENKIMFKR